MSPVSSPARASSWAGRWMVPLALLCGACHPPGAALPSVRVAAAGAHLPLSRGNTPPVSVFPGDRLPPPGTRLTCPVCGDEFLVEEAKGLRHYKGKVVIFCCARCLPHFDKNPDLFVGPGI